MKPHEAFIFIFYFFFRECILSYRRNITLERKHERGERQVCQNRGIHSEAMGRESIFIISRGATLNREKKL